MKLPTHKRNAPATIIIGPGNSVPTIMMRSALFIFLAALGSSTIIGDRTAAGTQTVADTARQTTAACRAPRAETIRRGLPVPLLLEAHHQRSRIAAGSPRTFRPWPDGRPKPAPWWNQIVTILGRKRYPSEARSRGERGVARLTFSIDGTRHLLSSHTVTSSGSATLDAETLALVQRRNRSCRRHRQQTDGPGQPQHPLMDAAASTIFSMVRTSIPPHSMLSCG